MPVIEVRTQSAQYTITIEPGLLNRIGECVRSLAPAQRAMLVVDSALVDDYLPIAGESLLKANYQVVMETVTAAESNKSMDAARQLYQAAIKGRIERSSPIIALGGGIAGDLTGFVAATFMRGVPFVQIPTTLLAMVDAAIGGKTGVNYEFKSDESASGGASGASLVKNIIGAFWQPRAVLIDPNVLKTLDRRELNCGLAECVKHAVIADPALFDFIERKQTAFQAIDIPVLTELIARSAQVKVDIVAEDEREMGRRALLNLGHTFGHAMEGFPELSLHHGESVAIGLCAAAECAVLTKRLSRQDADRIVDLMKAIGLPTQMPGPINAAALMTAMQHDKKVQSGRVRLILPTSIGSAEIVDDVPDDVVRSAWKTVGAT